MSDLFFDKQTKLEMDFFEQQNKDNGNFEKLMNISNEQADRIEKFVQKEIKSKIRTESQFSKLVKLQKNVESQVMRGFTFKEEENSFDFKNM